MEKIYRPQELEGEVRRLREELERQMVSEREFEGTRRALLYLLEDNNEYASGLLKAKNEWEATFDSISDLILIHDRMMRIVRCNRAYQAMAGIPFKEIIGRPYHEVFPRLPAPFRACQGTVGGFEAHDHEEEVEAPGTGRVFKVRFYVVKSQGGDNFIHIMEDVTEEKRAAENERILYEFTKRIAENLDLNYRLTVVCETAVRAGFRMAWIGLLDEATKEVAPMAHAGFEEGYLSTVKIRYDDSPLGQGPVGRAVRERAPAVLNRAAEDPAFYPWREEAVKRGYGSIASFPVIEEGRVIAVLSVYSIDREFPEKGVAFLRTFANQTASYIRNAMLFKEIKESAQKIKEEMELSRHLLAIAYATAHTTDIERLMEHVVESLKTIVDSDFCLSYLWDRERGAFQPCQASGLPRDMLPFFRVASVKPDFRPVKRAFDEMAPVMETFGPENACGPLAWIDGLDTAIAIPLMRKDEWLGLLLCVSAGNGMRPTGLSDRDRDVLGGISYQVSTALDEAKLYKESIDKTMELSRKIETIQIMHEIDKSILSTLEPKQILEIATVMVSRLIPCDRATVALLDRERDGFVFEAGFGVGFLDKGSLIPFRETSAAEVVKTGRPQYVADFREAKGLLPLEEKFVAEGFRSHLRVPVSVKGDLAGVLSVGSKRASAFSHEDLSLIEKLASQIGVALENARLVSDLSELFLGIVKTLSEAIDAKSPWTRGHSDRVTSIAMEIGSGMGLDEDQMRNLELAGLLHDIGKLGTYESILDKPGRLTEEEFEMMKRHPRKGAEILAPIKQMKNIVPAIRHHHEHFNGAGYPDGLRGDEIPLMARILAVADTVDAMSADRPYRKGKPMEMIAAELRRCSGTQFDPAVVDAYFRRAGL